jgi:DNA polymerase phi
MGSLEVPGHVLQHFWDLANVEAETRQHSAVRLVHELKSAQDAFVSTSSSDVPMGTGTDREGDENEAPPALAGCSPVLAYALKRLARGLGSGRSGARQGFALALTAAIAEIPLVSLSDGLRLLKTSLEPITQATKGTEARDILMGQLFGVAALVRAMSARLAGGEIELADAIDFASVVAQDVAALAKSKTYLAESACAVILEIVNSVGGVVDGTDGTVSIILTRAPALADWIATPANEATPEAVLLATAFWPALPAALRKRCDVLPPLGEEESNAADAVAAAASVANGAEEQAKKSKKKKDGGDAVDLVKAAATARWSVFFRASHLEKIRDALAESSHSHPQVHTVWGVLIDAARTFRITGALERLWDVLVEQGLMTSGSHQRRFLGFRLFASLLSGASAALVPTLFSDNFNRCLLNNLAKQDNYLHAAADDCLAHVLNIAKATGTPADVRLSIVGALQRLGPHRLDKVGDKKNAVRDLLGGLTGDDASEHARELMQIFVAAPEKVEGGAQPSEFSAEGSEADASANASAANKRRLWALEQATGLWPRLPRDTQTELCEFLVAHAYYTEALPEGSKPKKGKSLLTKVGVAPLASPTDGLREACAVRASALLAANVKARRSAATAGTGGKTAPGDTPKKEKGAKKSDTALDTKQPPPDLLAAAANLCRRLDAKDSGAVLVDQMPAECAAVRESLFESLAKLTDLEAIVSSKGSKDAAHSEIAAVTPLLRALAVLQVSDWREFTPAIEDLPRCVDDLLAPPVVVSKKKPSKKASQNKDEDEDDEPPPKPMDVLVDILLSLLAQPSALLRDVVEHVFKSIGASVSEASVGDMLRVVLAPDADNRNATADGDGDDEPALEDEGDESEEEEETEIGEEDDALVVDEEDSDEDDDDDENSDDENENENSDSDDASPVDEKRTALIKAALAKVGANIDSDEEDDPAENMDDDAMFGIDSLLGQAFKSRRHDIKRKKNMVVATRDFKFRVLALLELYARSQPASPWLPGAALPLLSAMRTALGQGTPQASALAERIGGVLTKHVCHARDLPTGAGSAPVTAEVVAASLASAIRAAAKPTGGGDHKGFAKPATAVCLYLLRVLEALGGQERGETAEGDEGPATPLAVAAYAGALKEFKTNKRCRLKSPFFNAAFDRHPALAAALLPEIAQVACAHTDKPGARGEFLRTEGLKLLATVLALGRKRSPGAAAAVKRHGKKVTLAVVTAIGAPCKNRGARGDTAKCALQCLEALGRLEPEGTPLSAVVDAEAVLAATRTQFLVPGMPPKGIAALTRACTLLGKVAPEASPSDEPVPVKEKRDDKACKTDKAGKAGKGKAKGGKGTKKDGKRDVGRADAKMASGPKAPAKHGRGTNGPATPKGDASGQKRKAPEDTEGGDRTPWKKKNRAGKAQREAAREKKKALAEAK